MKRMTPLAPRQRSFRTTPLSRLVRLACGGVCLVIGIGLLGKLAWPLHQFPWFWWSFVLLMILGIGICVQGGGQGRRRR